MYLSWDGVATRLTKSGLDSICGTLHLNKATAVRWERMISQVCPANTLAVTQMKAWRSTGAIQDDRLRLKTLENMVR